MWDNAATNKSIPVNETLWNQHTLVSSAYQVDIAGPSLSLHLQILFALQTAPFLTFFSSM